VRIKELSFLFKGIKGDNRKISTYLRDGILSQNSKYKVLIAFFPKDSHLRLIFSNIYLIFFYTNMCKLYIIIIIRLSSKISFTVVCKKYNIFSGVLYEILIRNRFRVISGLEHLEFLSLSFLLKNVSS